MAERVTFVNKSSHPLIEVMRSVYSDVRMACNLSAPFAVTVYSGGEPYKLLVTVDVRRLSMTITMEDYK